MAPVYANTYTNATRLEAALALSRWLSSQLYQVSPFDAAAYAGLTALMAVVALLACYLPARRALRIDPMRALREE
jgi:putative ABC transport system permease protein